QKEGVTEVLAQFTLVMADPAAERITREFIARPLRLPGNEVLTAAGPELGPGAVVAHVGRPEIEAADTHQRKPIAAEAGSEESHGTPPLASLRGGARHGLRNQRNACRH